MGCDMCPISLLLQSVTRCREPSGSNNPLKSSHGVYFVRSDNNRSHAIKTQQFLLLAERLGERQECVSLSPVPTWNRNAFSCKLIPRSHSVLDHTGLHLLPSPGFYETCGAAQCSQMAFFSFFFGLYNSTKVIF